MILTIPSVHSVVTTMSRIDKCKRCVLWTHRLFDKGRCVRAVVNFLRIAIAIEGAIRYNRTDNRVVMHPEQVALRCGRKEVEAGYGRDDYKY